jgi:hypothetical protein
LPLEIEVFDVGPHLLISHQRRSQFYTFGLTHRPAIVYQLTASTGQ